MRNALAVSGRYLKEGSIFILDASKYMEEQRLIEIGILHSISSSKTEDLTVS
jgi:hypothetical protein